MGAIFTLRIRTIAFATLAPLLLGGCWESAAIHVASKAVAAGIGVAVRDGPPPEIETRVRSSSDSQVCHNALNERKTAWSTYGVYQIWVSEAEQRGYSASDCKSKLSTPTTTKVVYTPSPTPQEPADSSGNLRGVSDYWICRGALAGSQPYWSKGYDSWVQEAQRRSFTVVDCRQIVGLEPTATPDTSLPDETDDGRAIETEEETAAPPAPKQRTPTPAIAEEPAEGRTVRRDYTITWLRGRSVSFQGDLVDGADEDIATAFRRAGNPSVLYITSRGGLVGVGYVVGIYVRQAGIGVVADRYCASACTSVLAGGTTRAMTEGTLVGVHQFSTEIDIDESDAQQSVGFWLLYFRGMGIDTQVVEVALQTPPSDIRFLTRRELVDWRLVEQII